MLTLSPFPHSHEWEITTYVLHFGDHPLPTDCLGTEGLPLTPLLSVGAAGPHLHNRSPAAWPGKALTQRLVHERSGLMIFSGSGMGKYMEGREE